MPGAPHGPPPAAFSDACDRWAQGLATSYDTAVLTSLTTHVALPEEYDAEAVGFLTSTRQPPEATAHLYHNVKNEARARFHRASTAASNATIVQFLQQHSHRPRSSSMSSSMSSSSSSSSSSTHSSTIVDANNSNSNSNINSNSNSNNRSNRTALSSFPTDIQFPTSLAAAPARAGLLAAAHSALGAPHTLQWHVGLHVLVAAGLSFCQAALDVGWCPFIDVEAEQHPPLVIWTSHPKLSDEQIAKSIVALTRAAVTDDVIVPAGNVHMGQQPREGSARADLIPRMVWRARIAVGTRRRARRPGTTTGSPSSHPISSSFKHVRRSLPNLTFKKSLPEKTAHRRYSPYYLGDNGVLDKAARKIEDLIACAFKQKSLGASSSVCDDGCSDSQTM